MSWKPKLQIEEGSVAPIATYPGKTDFLRKSGKLKDAATMTEILLRPLNNQFSLPAIGFTERSDTTRSSSFGKDDVDTSSGMPQRSPATKSSNQVSTTPEHKRIRTGIFLTIEILALVTAIVVVFKCDDISKVNPCDLESALDYIQLEYTPHPCQYHDIKDQYKIPFGFAIAYIVLKIVVFTVFSGCKYIYLKHKARGAKDEWKNPFHIFVAAVSFSFFLGFFLISIIVVHENKEKTNVNFDNLGSKMLSSLQKHFTSDDLQSGDTISTAWNKFFIKYDCCAVYEVTGTTNDFDNTPWCTTSGSCQSTSSQIPKTCCKYVTQENYQSATSNCHASVNPGTYKQSCLSHMKTLSVVNIDESEVLMLFYLLLILMMFQLLEFCLVLAIGYHQLKQHLQIGHGDTH